MPLDAMDEFDIQRSFEVLDEEKTNRITLSNFHTLFLGLGFQPKELTLQELKNKVAWSISHRKQSEIRKTPEDFDLFQANVDDASESFIPLSMVLEILSGYSRGDRNHETNCCFQLLDSSNKGYVSVEDVQRACQEIGEPISVEEAQAMLGTSEDNNNDSNRLGPLEFKKIFAPPSP